MLGRGKHYDKKKLERKVRAPRVIISDRYRLINTTEYECAFHLDNGSIDDGFINNKLLNFLLDKWFIAFENKMILPIGLDLIVMAEK